jgi:hypothetical protein
MRIVRTSVARILPPGDDGSEHLIVPRERWKTGDYVLGQVIGRGWPPWQIESATGRLEEVWDGDLLVGALGQRRATLEAVGDWREVGDDLMLSTLTRAGVLGRCTSAAPWVRHLIVPVAYRGHLAPGGSTISMSDVALPPREAPARLPPVVLLIASSMSAGKTTAAKAVIRCATSLGLRVAGVKLVGVGRYADILGMRDAGAHLIADFVDAGLPSTIAPASVVEDAVNRVLGVVEDAGADLLVAEAGASPLEPYGGDTAIAALRGHIAMTVLCASDAYAVRGVIEAFGVTPDLVAGRVAATTAGIDLVAALTGLEALDVTDPGETDRLRTLLQSILAARARERPDGAVAGAARKDATDRPGRDGQAGR